MGWNKLISDGRRAEIPYIKRKGYICHCIVYVGVYVYTYYLLSIYLNCLLFEGDIGLPSSSSCETLGRAGGPGTPVSAGG